MPDKMPITVALANFTRQVNFFHSLAEKENAQECLVTSQYEKVVTCWEKLEAAQDCFLEKSAIDIESDPDGLVFLNEPEGRYLSVTSRYSEFLDRNRTNEHLLATEQAKELQQLEISTRKQTALDEEQCKKM